MSGKNLHTIDECVRVVAQEILERSRGDEGQYFITRGAAYELLHDRPRGFRIMPDQAIEPIGGRREIGLLAAQGNRFGVIEVPDDKVFVLVHGFARC